MSFIEDAEVLGWVNMDKKKYVLIRRGDRYYRADYVVTVEKTPEDTQFSDGRNGWIFTPVHKICVRCHNRSFSYSPEEDDSKNIELYNKIVEFKNKTDLAGQIFY